jgi:CRP/FNR family transcriptional regulator, cyclic AMP receptor protein
VEPILNRVSIFAGLTDPALKMLLERAQTSTVAPGAIILREGESGNRFFLIAKGAVRVVKKFGETDEVELAVLHAGNFFGEMCILETLPRAATVQAVGETSLMMFSSVAFYELYEAMPEQYGVLVLNIARDISRRLRCIDEVFAARH